MSKLSSALIAFIVLLLVSYGVYDFYLNFEYKEKTIHTGYRGEARKNPFYASRLFLKRMGIPTKTLKSAQDLNKLPDTDTLLIITTKRSTLSPKRTDKLIDWVKSGGHLIALATNDWKYNGSEKDTEDDDVDEDTESPDPLMRYMGVRKASSNKFQERLEEEIIKNLDDAKSDSENDAANSEKQRIIPTITLKGVSKPLKLLDTVFRPIIVDDDHKEQTEEITLDSVTYMVRQKIGDGLITLITDMDFFTNREIEDYDHAEILWNLVHGINKPIHKPHQVWLIHNDNMAPLWDIIWRNFWALVISLSLLLFFWLFKISQRFGPIIPKQEENRRSLIEHITSSGFFYWKNNKQQILLESSRQALMQRLSRVHPGWTQYTEAEQVQRLAEQLSVEPSEVQKLLHAKNIEQADEFTETIKQLENIRKTI